MEARFALLLSRTASVGILLGFAATIYFLFGLAGHVHSSLLNYSVVAVLALAAAFFLVNFFTIPARTNWAGRGVWASILIFLTAEVMLGFLPPTSRDELTHHLAIPRLYANAGRIIEVPIAPYAYYPMLLDMLYTPWVYWGYDSVPKLIHALFAYLTGLLLYAYLARRMNALYGLLGFFMFISMPVVARLSHWGYIDLALTFYTTAAVLTLLYWREQRECLAWLNLSALSLGFALATKPNGMVAALLIGFLFLLVIAGPPRKPMRQVGREFAVFGGGVLIVFLPWLLKNWFQTGNPFYPFLGELFATRASAVPGGATFGAVGILSRRELLYQENVWQIVSLPIRLFFSGRDDNPQFFDGVLTPILLVFLPWTFKGKWLGEKTLLGGFALLFLFYAIFLVELRVRYVLPMVPALVTLAVYGIFNAYIRIKRPLVLFGVLVMFAGWHFVYLFSYVRGAQPFAYLVGAESREAYLTRTLPEYAAFKFINVKTEPSAKVYLLFVGRRAYYCEREYFHDSGDLPGVLLDFVRKATTAEEIAQSLKEMKLSHLMVRDDLLTAFLTGNLTPAQALVWNDFAATRLKPMFQARGYSVYQLDV